MNSVRFWKKFVKPNLDISKPMKPKKNPLNYSWLY